MTGRRRMGSSCTCENSCLVVQISRRGNSRDWTYKEAAVLAARAKGYRGKEAEVRSWNGAKNAASSGKDGRRRWGEGDRSVSRRQPTRFRRSMSPRASRSVPASATFQISSAGEGDIPERDPRVSEDRQGRQRVQVSIVHVHQVHIREVPLQSRVPVLQTGPRGCGERVSCVGCGNDKEDGG